MPWQAWLTLFVCGVAGASLLTFVLTRKALSLSELDRQSEALTKKLEAEVKKQDLNARRRLVDEVDRLKRELSEMEKEHKEALEKLKENRRHEEDRLSVYGNTDLDDKLEQLISPNEEA